MHNYYMWHGGNHYGNWSQAAPSAAGANGPLSSTNTVRYANAAPLHSDGTRNEPLWSHVGKLHAALAAAAAPVRRRHANCDRCRRSGGAPLSTRCRRICVWGQVLLRR